MYPVHRNKLRDKGRREYKRARRLGKTDWSRWKHKRLGKLERCMWQHALLLYALCSRCTVSHLIKKEVHSPTPREIFSLLLPKYINQRNFKDPLHLHYTACLKNIISVIKIDVIPQQDGILSLTEKSDVSTH